jgi:hypothetical protein
MTKTELVKNLRNCFRWNLKLSAQKLTSLHPEYVKTSKANSGMQEEHVMKSTLRLT